MRRLGVMVVMIGALVGCQQGGGSGGSRETAAYQCTPSEGASSSSQKPRRLTVIYDTSHKQALISLDGGTVNYLDMVPGDNEGLYSNAKYAWKSDSSTGQFTDIADVRVYSCVRAADAAALPARAKF